MALEFALQALGPRGGNLENPQQNPVWRQSKNNATIQPETGLPALHRFEDTAASGFKNEQPWHKMAAFMLLAGRTNSEIALAAGVHPNTVSILRAQRWFQELLATLANEAGQDILGLLASEAAASVEKLVTLRDTAESERVQLAAATTLLEHANGKAVQKVISHTSHSVYRSPEDELRAVEEELNALRNRNNGGVPALPPTQ